MKRQKTLKSQNNLEKEQSWRHYTSQFQQSKPKCMVLAVRIDIQTDGTKLRAQKKLYSQLIFDEGAKNTQWRKDSHYNKLCWGNWIYPLKRMKSYPFLLPLTRIYMKWVVDFSVRPEIAKHLDELKNLPLDTTKNEIISHSVLSSTEIRIFSLFQPRQ